jgi:hypothetical protein
VRDLVNRLPPQKFNWIRFGSFGGQFVRFALCTVEFWSEVKFRFGMRTWTLRDIRKGSRTENLYNKAVRTAQNVG